MPQVTLQKIQRQKLMLYDNNRSSSIKYLAFVIWLAFCVTSNAQTLNSYSEESTTEYSNTNILVAKDWNLSTEEVETLQYLKRRNEGLLSTNITPFEWLGIFAESDDQRIRYATLFAQRQFEIVDSIMKFESAYAKAMENLISKSKNDLPTSKRFLLITSYQCDDSACKENLNRALKQSEKGAKLDIFVQEKVSNAELRLWVVAKNIPLDKIRARKITINSAPGRFQHIRKGLFELD